MSGIINRITSRLSLRQPPARETSRAATVALDSGRIKACDVVNILWNDPMSAATVLKRANQSYYGMRGSVGSLLHAVEVLGPESCLTMLSSSSEHAVESPVSDAVIRHARATAFISHRLATGAWLTTEDCLSRPGLVATAGLLHSIGRLALCASFPAETESLYGFSELSFPVSGSKTELEQLQFGIDYSEIGEFIGRKLHFPTELTLCIKGHTTPSTLQKDSAGRRLAAIIGTAALVAEKCGYGMEPQVSIPYELQNEKIALFQSEAALQDDDIRRVCDELNEMDLNKADTATTGPGINGSKAEDRKPEQSLRSVGKSASKENSTTDPGTSPATSI